MLATINCEEYEYEAEPTDGVSLGTGAAWWGVSVRWRKVGSRRWQRFVLVDVHSWDRDAQVAAIEWQIDPPAGDQDRDGLRG